MNSKVIFLSLCIFLLSAVSLYSEDCKPCGTVWSAKNLRLLNLDSEEVNKKNVPIGSYYYFDFDARSPNVNCEDEEGNGIKNEKTGKFYFSKGKSINDDPYASVGFHTYSYGCCNCFSKNTAAEWFSPFFMEDQYPGWHTIHVEYYEGQVETEYSFFMTVANKVDLRVTGPNVFSKSAILSGGPGSEQKANYFVTNLGELSATVRAKIVASDSEEDIKNFISSDFTDSTNIVVLDDRQVISNLNASEKKPVKQDFIVPNMGCAENGHRYFAVIVYAEGVPLSQEGAHGVNYRSETVPQNIKLKISGKPVIVGQENEKPPELYAGEEFEFKLTKYLNKGKSSPPDEGTLRLWVKKKKNSKIYGNHPNAAVLADIPFSYKDQLTGENIGPNSGWIQGDQLPTLSAIFNPMVGAFGNENPEEVQFRFIQAEFINIPCKLDTKQKVKSKPQKINVSYPTVTITEVPEDWEPKGRLASEPAGSPGNTVTFTATVESGVEHYIRFELSGVSSEPGICMNWGDPTIPGESTLSKDLKFLENNNQGFSSPISNDLVITTSEKVSEATVTVTCLDYGAWGEINAFAVDDNGNPLGIISEKENLPKDNNGNNIWDGYQGDNWDGTDPKWDEEDDHFGTNGDGLTRYEEYRGFMKKSVFKRMSPVVKEIFVYSPDELGVAFFGDLAMVEEVAMDELNQNPQDMFIYNVENPVPYSYTTGYINSSKHTRVANFNSSSHHKVDQHGLVVFNVLDPQSHNNGGRTVKIVSGSTYLSPKSTWYINIFTGNLKRTFGPVSGSDFSWDARSEPLSITHSGSTDPLSMYDHELLTTISHEFGHGVSIEHHGDLSILLVNGYPSDFDGTGKLFSFNLNRKNEAGVANCCIRYQTSLYLAAICGDLEEIPDGEPDTTLFGSPVEPDRDWYPRSFIKNIYCSSHDNCKSQVVIDDSDG